MFELRGYLYSDEGMNHLHLHAMPAEQFAKLPGAQELVKSYNTLTPPFLTKELLAHHGAKDILITFYCDDLDGVRQWQSKLNRSSQPSKSGARRTRAKGAK